MSKAPKHFVEIKEKKYVKSHCICFMFRDKSLPKRLPEQSDIHVTLFFNRACNTLKIGFTGVYGYNENTFKLSKHKTIGNYMFSSAKLVEWNIPLGIYKLDKVPVYDQEHEMDIYKLIKQ